jgi:hypothetical protein
VVCRDRDTTNRLTGGTSASASTGRTSPPGRQCIELTKPQSDVLARLDLTPPEKIVELAATPA